MLKKFFDFFVFTSLFIACCAVLMVYQTALLFGLQLEFPVYVFVFSGAVCSYNFHWFLTPPFVPDSSYKLRWNISNRPLHLGLSIVGMMGAGISSFLLLEHWPWLFLTAFLTFLYSAPKIDHPLFTWLRKIAIGKTIFLAFSWAHVTALLPLLIFDNLETLHIWFVINRFFFIYAICIVFDRRDVKKDKEAGIKSLITLLSDKGIDNLFWFSQTAVGITTIILAQWLTLTNLVILLVPSLIMGLLYERTKTNTSDYLYYFLLDGLMALSAPILILAKFAR